MPRVVACGGRDNAYDKFCHAIATARDDQVVILLVDSEGPLADRAGPWSHLQKRDGWHKPAGATDDQVQLMVQCMESWFLADKDCLVQYFGPRFNRGSLPGSEDIENVPKKDVLDGIRNATRRCGNPYDKGRHSFVLLAELNPQKVADASPHARQLLARLRSIES